MHTKDLTAQKVRRLSKSSILDISDIDDKQDVIRLFNLKSTVQNKRLD